MRGKAAEDFIGKHAEIGLYQPGHERDDLHEEGEGICGNFSVGIV